MHITVAAEKGVEVLGCVGVRRNAVYLSYFTLKGPS